MSSPSPFLKVIVGILVALTITAITLGIVLIQRGKPVNLRNMKELAMEYANDAIGDPSDEENDNGEEGEKKQEGSD